MGELPAAMEVTHAHDYHHSLLFGTCSRHHLVRTATISSTVGERVDNDLPVRSHGRRWSARHSRCRRRALGRSAMTSDVWTALAVATGMWITAAVTLIDTDGRHDPTGVVWTSAS